MRRFTYFSLVLIAISSLYASGCSNTVTNDSSRSEETTPVFGRPTVKSTNPYNGQVNVSINSAITVVFSSPMNLDTVNNETFTLTDQDDYLIEGTISCSGRSATFTPDEPLVIDGTYTAYLSDEIKGKFGRPMKESYEWTFQTNSYPSPLQLSSHHVTDNGDFTGWGTTFDYEDISETGTDTGLSVDDGYAEIPIGFTFHIYDNDYTTAFVGTNGYITFDRGDSRYSNYPFPSADYSPYSPYPLLPNRRIAAYFDDLWVRGGGKILYQVKGTAPDRRLIVQWHNIAHYDTQLDIKGDFEIILYETTNAVQFQYLNVSNIITDEGAYGASATVGLNRGDGIDDTLYSYDTPYLEDGRSIIFYPVGYYSLTTLYPYDGATEVDLDTPLYAFFNKPLDTSTITDAFSLVETVGSIPVDCQVAGIYAGNSVVLAIPDELLKYETDYTATFSTELGDIYGVHLLAPITWSFSTEEK